MNGIEFHIHGTLPSNEKRIRRLKISREAFADMFKENIVTMDGLPDDARLLSIYPGDWDGYVLYIESAEFSPLEEGAHVPVMSVTCRDLGHPVGDLLED